MLDVFDEDDGAGPHVLLNAYKNVESAVVKRLFWFEKHVNW